MLENSLNLDLYPIVVRQSRYSGVYEGGLWFAIANYSDDDLSAAYRSYVDGDDCDAVDFWQSDESKGFGVGENPDGAVLSLMRIHLEKHVEEKTYTNLRDDFNARVASREHESQHSKYNPIFNVNVEKTDYSVQKFQSKLGPKDN